MGKKKPEVTGQRNFVTFEAGMKENGFSSEAIKALWDTIEPFAAYAFNKSHAAGYGLVSFWTGYLKANYTSEYMPRCSPPWQTAKISPPYTLLTVGTWVSEYCHLT